MKLRRVSYTCFLSKSYIVNISYKPWKNAYEYESSKQRKRNYLLLFLILNGILPKRSCFNKSNVFLTKINSLAELNPDIIENKTKFFNMLQTIINSIFASVLNNSDKEIISKLNEHKLNKEINDFLLDFDNYKFTSDVSSIYESCNISLLNTTKKFLKTQKQIEKGTYVMFDRSLTKCLNIIKSLEKIDILDIFTNSTIMKLKKNNEKENDNKRSSIDMNDFNLNAEAWLLIQNKFKKVDEVRIKIMVLV